MSSNIYVGKNAEAVTLSPELLPFTRVTIRNDTDEYTIGDDSGRLLDLTLPYATSDICQDIYNRVYGYAYRPVYADNAIMDPAAEIGDAITTSGAFSGIYKQEISFGPLMLQSCGAEEDEEIDNEYTFTGGSGKYATYTALASGSCSVNGSALIAKTVTATSLVDKTVTGEKIADATVEGSNVASDTISYGNTTFQGTLDQVGTNAADISAIQGYFTGSASFGALVISGNGFYMNGKHCYPSTITLNDGTTRAVMVWQDT